MKQPIRILHVLGHLVRGGAETMVMNLYRNIDRSKIQFDFVVHTSERYDYDDEVEKMGGNIHRVPRYNGKNHFEYKKAWKKLFSDFPEYKIIHAHVRSTASIFLGIAKKNGLTTIAHSHNTSDGGGITGLTKRIYQYPIRYKADYLFSCSRKAGKWLFGNESLNKKKHYLVNNAIDINDYKYNIDARDNMRKKLKIENKFVVGNIGRFSTQKNHKFIIEIFNELLKLNNESILLLVGDGELRESIEKRAEELEILDKVIFTGVRDDIPNLLQVMDVFLFPSLHEGLGIVAIEAQAAGLLTIVSEEIPKEAYLTNLVKMISLKRRPEFWASQILEYGNGYKREDTSELIKSGGYDIKEVTKRLENFYLSL